MTVDAQASPLRARRIPAGIAVPVVALGADADMLLGTRVLPRPRGWRCSGRSRWPLRLRGGGQRARRCGCSSRRRWR
ncbi:hypothetical protein ACRAWB_11370 [Leifsonia poae]|uniref:hypothetical protein n=1 Tax=Leifsonia poae TaxID=110933 RepID=UPI003D68DAFB